MGLEHGVYCMGCCWILMCLLFFGGVMSIWWIAGRETFIGVPILSSSASILTGAEVDLRIARAIFTLRSSLFASLLAPLTWQFFRLNWVWPDSVLIATLTTIGLTIGVWVLVRPESSSIDLRFRPQHRFVAAVFLFSLYLLSPPALTYGPLSADYLSIATLRETDGRVGRKVRFDRRPYEARRF